MKNREQLLMFLTKKLEGDLHMTYDEIANATGYHPKYILRLKKTYLKGTVSLIHGNKNRKPASSISKEEEEKIISLYKRSNASIRKFAQFYSRRSYSCIYNILKKNQLI